METRPRDNREALSIRSSSVEQKRYSGLRLSLSRPSAHLRGLSITFELRQKLRRLDRARVGISLELQYNWLELHYQVATQPPTRTLQQRCSCPALSDPLLVSFKTGHCNMDASRPDKSRCLLADGGKDVPGPWPRKRIESQYPQRSAPSCYASAPVVSREGYHTNARSAEAYPALVHAAGVQWSTRSPPTYDGDIFGLPFPCFGTLVMRPLHPQLDIT
jgi:hypothetical protein